MNEALWDMCAARGNIVHMSRDTLREVRVMKDDSGRYLWEPGLRVNGRTTIMGYPIHVDRTIPPREIWVYKAGECLLKVTLE